jgi:hypothetical protein
MKVGAYAASQKKRIYMKCEAMVPRNPRNNISSLGLGRALQARRLRILKLLAQYLCAYLFTQVSLPFPTWRL